LRRHWVRLIPNIWANHRENALGAVKLRVSEISVSEYL